MMFFFRYGQSQGEVTPLLPRIELMGQVAYKSIWELSASTMMLFSTLYINFIGSYWRETLMTQDDPCDGICDVT